VRTTGGAAPAWGLAAGLAAGVAAGAAVAAAPASYDLVITNARLVDGTGAAARAGVDVGVRAGRIARVGRIAATDAGPRLDATGLVLAPGFIDVHTHADDVARKPLAENFIRMGVTSIVAGNCGSSALRVAEALDEIRDETVAVNFATFIGHNTVRAAVMGHAARDPSLPEARAMQVLVFKGLAEGAVGFSTGLQYVPGVYAQANEIIELARVAANEGGIYATHMRNEGTDLAGAVAESIRVIRRVDMPLQISHLKVDSPSAWGASAAALKLIDDARVLGLRIAADQYAYTAGSSSLAIRFPAWALEGGADAVRARLHDPAAWPKIKAEMQAALAARGFTDLSWATVARYRPDPSLDGQSMAQVARKMIGDESPGAQLEAARILMLNGGASMIYRFMDEGDVARIMRHPMVAVASDAGISDAGDGAPHPRGSGNTARVLGEYVRERQVLPLEEAVRKMTSLPAEFFGFAGRGVVREGAAADLVLFDPAAVRDLATYENPRAFPAGIPHVLVNGVFVVRDGRTTGARPGRILLRRPPKPR
jgi:N-acyl-D-amino-acid deacylase